MNWFKNIMGIKILFSKSFSMKRKGFEKFAYSSKKAEVEFAATGARDGYSSKIQLTSSKTAVILSINVISDIYAFPLFEDVWEYPKTENKRAIKTYNRCLNVLEDLKTDFEDDDVPGPTLQGMVREALRFIDVDRKKNTNNRSHEAAKLEPGEADWRSSLYGNRYPSTTINISNSGTFTINGAK